jgi:Holliday junction resolvase RusA-like endonuclease
VTLRFTVLGKPEPAGSKRAFTNPRTGKAMVVDANKNAAPWKQQVAGAARVAFYDEAGHRRPSALLEGPISLSVRFYVKRPRGHYGTGKNADRLRRSAPRYPTTKPDATKLLRGVEDALTGIVWRDDAQIVDQYVAKRYGTPERCEIAVEETLELDARDLAT